MRWRSAALAVVLMGLGGTAAELSMGAILDTYLMDLCNLRPNYNTKISFVRSGPFGSSDFWIIFKSLLHDLLYEAEVAIVVEHSHRVSLVLLALTFDSAQHHGYSDHEHDQFINICAPCL